MRSNSALLAAFMASLAPEMGGGGDAFGNPYGYGDPYAMAAMGYGNPYGDAFGGPMKLHFTPAQMAHFAAVNNAAAMGQRGPHMPARVYAPHLPGLPPPPPAQEAGRRTLDAVYWGIDSGATLILTTAAATITATPQQRCVPLTMSLTEPIAEGFLISSILVGVMPVLITTGSISPAIFVQNSTAPTFKRYMLEVGTNFSVSVTNITGGSLRFSATAIGENHAVAAC